MEMENEELTDIDVNDWLSEPSDEIGHHLLPNGKTLKIASLTDADMASLSKSSLRRDPRDGKMRIDPLVYRRGMVAASINKANGKNPTDPGYLTEAHLITRKTGDLTELTNAICVLSGINPKDEASDNFLG